jgi:anti-anti-sigma regulatory factor
MDIQEESAIGVPILRLRGTLAGNSDYWQLQELVRTCLARGRRNLLLDLSHVAKVDAVGLSGLLAALGDVRLAGGELRLAGVGCDDLAVVTKLLVEFEPFEPAGDAAGSVAGAVTAQSPA